MQERTLGPVTSTRRYHTIKKPDWWRQHHGDPANVTGTTSGKRDRHSTGTTQRPALKTRERFGGNQIATHLVKPEDEGDSDDNGVEPEVSLVQMEMEVGTASDNLSTDIDDVFATERSDKPPSSLELNSLVTFQLISPVKRRTRTKLGV